MDLRYLTPDEYEAWDRLVAESPYGTMFEASSWFTAVADATGEDIAVAAAFEGEQLVGGVVIERSSLWGLKTARLPSFGPANSCIMARRPSKSLAKIHRHIWAVTGALAEFLRAEFSCVAVTNHPDLADVRAFRWQNWWVNVLYTYCIDLETVELSSFTKTRRQGIRQAERGGVVRDEDPTPAKFYQLLEATCQRQGIRPSVTWEQTERFCELQGDRIVIGVACDGGSGRPLAGCLTSVDRTRGMAYALLAGFDPEYSHLRATSLLRWFEIEDLREMGIKTLDLVGADVESNARFKAEFEGRLVPYYQVTSATFPYRIVSRLAGR